MAAKLAVHFDVRLFSWEVVFSAVSFRVLVLLRHCSCNLHHHRSFDAFLCSWRTPLGNFNSIAPFTEWWWRLVWISHINLQVKPWGFWSINVTSFQCRQWMVSWGRSEVPRCRTDNSQYRVLLTKDEFSSFVGFRTHGGREAVWFLQDWRVEKDLVAIVDFHG